MVQIPYRKMGITGGWSRNYQAEDGKCFDTVVTAGSSEGTQSGHAQDHFMPQGVQLQILERESVKKSQVPRILNISRP